MPDMVEVEYVEQGYESGMGCEVFRVATLITHGDGRTDRFLRLYPAWAVAARMAEYNVSQAQAVRMLIAEPHVPHDGFVPPVIADPIWRRGAQEHITAVEQTVATLGFNPLAERYEERPADPTAVMRQLDVPAGLVEDLRLRHADVRAGWRDATAAETLASGRPPAEPAAPTTTVGPLPG